MLKKGSNPPMNSIYIYINSTCWCFSINKIIALYQNIQACTSICLQFLSTVHLIVFSFSYTIQLFAYVFFRTLFYCFCMNSSVFKRSIIFRARENFPTSRHLPAKRKIWKFQEMIPQTFFDNSTTFHSGVFRRFVKDREIINLIFFLVNTEVLFQKSSAGR